MEQTKILVVDDDREIVGAIAALLELEGYTVLRAYDGLEALDALHTHDVQLMILDVMMPRMDGLSATMQIRKEKNVPILLLSAKTEDADKIAGLAIGADDYITKPYNPMELVARVKAMLRRYLALEDAGESTGEERVRLLRQQRCRLLEDIHRRQKLLDCLDYMIHEAKKEGGPPCKTTGRTDE